MFFSHLLRRESLHWLGFRLRDRRDWLKELVPRLLLIALPLLAAGVLLRTIRQIGFGDAFLDAAVYLPWAFAQQYALNGYFLNRFDAVVSARAASLLAALLFSLAHAPNLFLMLITLPLGWCATLFYRRSRNLYLVGMAHAAVGLLLFLVVPDTLSRHMRVGPGWFRP
jgi:membrane protease YdiL (CAAX protease family)